MRSFRILFLLFLASNQKKTWFQTCGQHLYTCAMSKFTGGTINSARFLLFMRRLVLTTSLSLWVSNEAGFAQTAAASWSCLFCSAKRYVLRSMKQWRARHSQEVAFKMKVISISLEQCEVCFYKIDDCKFSDGWNGWVCKSISPNWMVTHSDSLSTNLLDRCSHLQSFARLFCDRPSWTEGITSQKQQIELNLRQ